MNRAQTPPCDHGDSNLIAVLVGMAIGDAAGARHEFAHAAAGEWTDETAMAMCTAESLLRHRELRTDDLLDRLRQWLRAGYWSCGEDAGSVDNGITKVVEAFERGGMDQARSVSLNAEAACGDLVRAVPVVLFNHSGRRNHTCAEAEIAVKITGQCGLVAAAARPWALWLEQALLRGNSPVKPFRGAAGMEWLEAITDLAVAGPGFRDALPRLRAIADRIPAGVRWTPSALGAIYGSAAAAAGGSACLPSDAVEELAWRRQITRLGGHILRAGRDIGPTAMPGDATSGHGI